MKFPFGKIPAIIIGIVIFIAIAVGAFSIISSRAGGSVAPKSVTVSEISTNSVRITWETDSGSLGSIVYGTSEGSLNFYAPETGESPVTQHSVELTMLTPSTPYYFRIKVGDQIFGNGGTIEAGGVSWQFATKAKGGNQPVVPTGAGNPTPTPVQKVVIPTVAPTASDTCGETDCEKIKAKLGLGCDIQYYVQHGCLGTTGTPTPTTTTATPTQSLVP